MSARCLFVCLPCRKWLGQLSEGANSWFNSIEDDGCIHHSCTLATQTGRNAHRGPNLGQVVSAPWARELFVPHAGHVMVGADLEGLELRCLGHYLARFDEGAFAEVVLNGDIHQQNADRVGCTRKEVKTLTYAFIYGAGDQKLGHSLSPELSDAQKKQLGQELRRKFLDAIPGLEPLIDAVKERVRGSGRLRALDGRPIFCRAEHAALNYLLQSAGAILSKRWVVIGQDLIDQAGLTYHSDYTRCAYVHDEVQLSVLPIEADHVVQLLEQAAPLAGQYYNFKVPITASGAQGINWAANVRREPVTIATIIYKCVEPLARSQVTRRGEATGIHSHLSRTTMSNLTVQGLISARKKELRSQAERQHHINNELQTMTWTKETKLVKCYTYRGVQYCYN
jgi:hypothetical protein